MISIAKAWVPQENYWTLHPMAQTFGAFKKFYSKDKSKKKEESSKIMWAIATLVDPHEDNLLRNQSEQERKTLIAVDYLEDPDFNWDHPEILELREFYFNNCLTIAEKELLRYEEKLVQRGDFIAKTTYTMDDYDERTGKVIKGTADQLDKMMLNSGKIFDQIEGIKEKLLKEELDGQLKGGATESAAEGGLL
jgi:hypothetical protein